MTYTYGDDKQDHLTRCHYHAAHNKVENPHNQLTPLLQEVAQLVIILKHTLSLAQVDIP